MFKRDGLSLRNETWFHVPLGGSHADTDMIIMMMGLVDVGKAVVAAHVMVCCV